jgi:hypothetical protein
MVKDHSLASGAEWLVGTEQGQVFPFGLIARPCSLRFRPLLVISSRPLSHCQANQVSVSVK